MMNLPSLKWTVLQTEVDCRDVLIRLRQFPPTQDRGSHPTRLNVFWEMTEPDENGLATEAEAARLAAFEDRIVVGVEFDEQSILCAVLTGGGEREFVFQTRDSDVFLQRLGGMRQEGSPYPIRIHRSQDPEWAYFDSISPP